MVAKIMAHENIDFLNARKRNIANSPKQDGSGDKDSKSYLHELGVELQDRKQPIQFTPNINECIHRWAPYVQGFSAAFVQSIIDKYREEYKNPVILDPFAGCGTVLVQAKLNGIRSVGIELNPLLAFIAETKLNSWTVNPEKLIRYYDSIPMDKYSAAPEFLKSSQHFGPGVLKNLELIKGGIESMAPRSKQDKKCLDLIWLAFSSILIETSKLKRAPCLGYSKNKKIEDNAPHILLRQKIYDICEDLKAISLEYKECINVESNIIQANSMIYKHTDKFDLAITSPPYMNGLDYVINYKIEMGWLGFAKSQRELKGIKDDMVVCDNVSKGLIRDFSFNNHLYTNDWIEKIKSNINRNIERRGSYRRTDMATIVHKYFDDLYRVLKNVGSSLKTNGRFVLVLGDSLIADTYVPTDILIGKIGWIWDFLLNQ